MEQWQTEHHPSNVRGNKERVESEASLLGTLISVFGVGIFILFSWVAVFALYLSRS